MTQSPLVHFKTLTNANSSYTNQNNVPHIVLEQMPEQALHDEERHAQLLVLPADGIVALRIQAALGQDFREWRCKKMNLGILKKTSRVRAFVEL